MRHERHARWAISIGKLMALLTFITCFQAHPDYGENTKALFQRHLSWNLGFSSAPLLQVPNGGSRDQKIAELLPMVRDLTEIEDPYDADEVEFIRHDVLNEIMAQQGEIPNDFKRTIQLDEYRIIESEDGTSIKKDGNFSLRVYNRGHGFAFVNDLNNYGKHDNQEFRISETEAEAVGREIITRYGIVPPEDEEQLAFAKTEYIHFTGKATDPEDRDVSTVIFFHRQLNGIPFIGFKGSTIMIELIANYDIYSIFVDWVPFSSSSENQSVVSFDGFKRRLTGHIKNSFLSNPDNGLMSIYPPYEAHVEIDRIVCGYFDQGGALGNATFMQLACAMTLIINSQRSLQMHYLPIGDPVLPQEQWDISHEMASLEALADDPRINVIFVDN